LRPRDASSPAWTNSNQGKLSPELPVTHTG